VAERLGSLRWPALALCLLAAIAVVYLALLRDSAAEPRLVSSEAVAVIGSGSSTVAVAGDGTILTWLRLPAEPQLPRLPLEALPQAPRVQGPALEQVRVLAGAPAALRPYVIASRAGESGVDVELSSGIELRFGDSSAVARKWRAATAVLADPEVASLDYVDLHAPAHPAVYGSGHTLPALP
jgi:cell division protein FtsQ